jgi:peptidoglycan hydrolase-like protein with peptidoglycan-binding domain
MQTSLVKQRDVELVDTQERFRDIQAKLDELLLSRDQRIGQYEKELANVAKLEAKENWRQSDYDSRTRRGVELRAKQRQTHYAPRLRQVP